MPAIISPTSFDPLDINWKSHRAATRGEEVHLATALLPARPQFPGRQHTLSSSKKIHRNVKRITRLNHYSKRA
jgi:hypothetical protein